MPNLGFWGNLGSSVKLPVLSLAASLPAGGVTGGIFALRAHCALLLDYVPPEEPPSTPLGNALRIR